MKKWLYEYGATVFAIIVLLAILICATLRILAYQYLINAALFLLGAIIMETLLSRTKLSQK